MDFSLAVEISPILMLARDCNIVGWRLMPLLVLVVGEPAPRSALAGGLAMRGADVVTAHGPEDPALLRILRGGEMLVIEPAMIPGGAGNVVRWMRDACAAGRWGRVLLLDDGFSLSDADRAALAAEPALASVERRRALAAIAEHLPPRPAQEERDATEDATQGPMPYKTTGPDFPPADQATGKSFGNRPAANAMRNASDRLRTSSLSIRLAR